jgi:adenylate cyclase
MAREEVGMTVAEVAASANVDEVFIQHLVGLGVLPVDAARGLDMRDVRRARLLYAWDQAGLPITAVAKMLTEKTLSLDFLDAPSLLGPAPVDRSYGELASDGDVGFHFVQQLRQALGFTPPRPEDRAREDESQLLSVAQDFLEIGVEEGAFLGLVRTYADSLRRIAKAEAELYETHIEEPLRERGLSERQLIDAGTRFGGHVLPALERALLSIYRRHREHVWIEHAVYHAEITLEDMGLHDRLPKSSAICFVDLTGYTRLTEQRGDEVAARVARELSALVYEISNRHAGSPIRWLGDGGMFRFRHPGSAVLAGLEMAELAPDSGLPPTHIGIHTGPVIYQDGDVYGRTVNIASRIASRATAGEVLVSEETLQRVDDEGLSFEALPPVELKGLAAAMQLYRVARKEPRVGPPGARA